MNTLGVLPLPDIQRLLVERYEVRARDLTEVAGSADLDSFVYRLDAYGGNRYLLKLRAKRGFRPASLLVPAYLQDQGIQQVVAPLRTVDGNLSALVRGFVLILYPWLEARTVAEVGLGLEGWREFGSTMRTIHQTELPAELLVNVPRESFIPSRRGHHDFLKGEIDELLTVDRERIETLLEFADSKGDELRKLASTDVVCHGDLHGWNLLNDGGDRWWIVDWDEVVLAPKERDLMFVMKGIGHGLVRPEETEAFLSGYGNPDVDEELLSYFRCARAVQDIAAYAEALAGEEAATRASALRGLESLFAPGNIVDIATDSIEGLDTMRR